MIGGRLGLMALAALAAGVSDEMVAWRPSLEGGVPTEDPRVLRYSLERVISESAALVDGSSEVVRRRLQMMESVEGVLAL